MVPFADEDSPFCFTSSTTCMLNRRIVNPIIVSLWIVLPVRRWLLEKDWHRYTVCFASISLLPRLFARVLNVKSKMLSTGSSYSRHSLVHGDLQCLRIRTCRDPMECHLLVGVKEKEEKRWSSKRAPRNTYMSFKQRHLPIHPSTSVFLYYFFLIIDDHRSRENKEVKGTKCI